MSLSQVRTSSTYQGMLRDRIQALGLLLLSTYITGRKLVSL